MRILQVYRDYFTRLPGGIERHVHDLAHGLKHLGQMEIVASSRRRGSTIERDRDVVVHLVSQYGRPRGIPLSPGYVSTIARGSYDIVHLHALNPTGELAFKLSRTKARGIMTYHADLDRGARAFPVYKHLLRWAMQSCRRVIASSDELVRGSRVLAPIAETQPEKIVVIPLGVDVDRFHPADTERAAEFRAQWGPGPIVLFVGRLRYYKGLEYLIGAMTRLEGTLVLAGGGPEEHRLSQLGRDALGPRLKLLGHFSEEDLPHAYRAADVLALPSTSRAEAFGLVALEAMASGIPVVTTEVGTATSVVNVDGQTGFVVPPKDEEVLATAIEKVTSDPALAGQLGTAAHSRAVGHYDRRFMLERVERVYNEVVLEEQ